MTEQGTYRVASCPVCKTPVTSATGEDGTVYTHAAYASDRERQQVYAALVGERAEVVRLRGELDKARQERDGLGDQVELLRGAFDEHERKLSRLAQQRDSARKWAARWKRCASIYRKGEWTWTKELTRQQAKEMMLGEKAK